MHWLNGDDKELVWLHGEVKTPPFSLQARRTAGFLLRLIQRGNLLSMPDSRPMPTIGPRCHELRIQDAQQRVTWRIIYRIDSDAIVIGEVFEKKTRKTPQFVIDACQRRFKLYDRASQ
jgi:phage-related protein